jgi:hypothetical protein
MARNRNARPKVPKVNCTRCGKPSQDYNASRGNPAASNRFGQGDWKLGCNGFLCRALCCHAGPATDPSSHDRLRSVGAGHSSRPDIGHDHRLERRRSRRALSLMRSTAGRDAGVERGMNLTGGGTRRLGRRADQAVNLKLSLAVWVTASILLPSRSLTKAAK